MTPRPIPPPPDRGAPGSPRRRRRSAATGRPDPRPPSPWTRGKPVIPFPRVPASEEQRAKVATLSCAVCGRTPVDPAHMVPRTRGGCEQADCVIALCRTHHRLYDRDGLTLAPYIDEEFRTELVHALTHVSAAELRRGLHGDGWNSA